MRSKISDAISIGVFAGIGKGGSELGASAMASKNIVHGKDATFDVFYGLTASRSGVLPTLGAGGTYKDVIYSIYTNKLGAGAFVGMKA